MDCAWEALMSILPVRMRGEIDKLGREELEELRFRLHRPVEMVLRKGQKLLNFTATPEDIRGVVNTASRYSPWTASTAARGYITAQGGHRIGLCGDCVIREGMIAGIRDATSLCIRVARDFPGIGNGIPLHGSLLILGPPGAGKTTLLRDLIRLRSNAGSPVVTVDERGELFSLGQGFAPGIRTDVLTGCSKTQGIDIALRTMGPACIAVDEITAEEDCNALLTAGWCGVDLLATAHASSVTDLQKRMVYRPLWECGLFSKAVILGRDKSWYMERMGICT